MKVFIVFAAVIAVTYANAVGRLGWNNPKPNPSSGSGWGSNPSPGWGSSSPLLANLNTGLSASAAAAGAGQTSGSQSLELMILGDWGVPTLSGLSAADGIQSVVAQGEDVSQVSVLNKPSASSSTINTADVYQQTGSVDVLQAHGSGSDYAFLEHLAQTQGSGEGAIATETESLNQPETGLGWKKN